MAKKSKRTAHLKKKPFVTKKGHFMAKSKPIA